MKRIIFLIGLLVLILGTNINAQLKARDGIPLTMLSSTTQSADEAGKYVTFDYDCNYTVQVYADSISGGGGCQVLLQASNNGANWVTLTTTNVTRGTANYRAVPWTANNTLYYMYRAYYNELTSSVFNIRITMLARRNYY